MKLNRITSLLFLCLSAQAVAMGDETGSQVAVSDTQPVMHDQFETPSDKQKQTEQDDDEIGAFGQWLFKGAFKDQSFIGFSPEYVVGVNDTITITLWGMINDVYELTVDAQGNVFIPSVGPLKLQGVKNKDINTVVTELMSRSYKNSVGVYANLLAAQPVKIFVSGHVQQPGLYQGHSSDAILKFIDLAGGIKTGKGSYREIKILRNNHTMATVNLYDFVKNGHMEQVQLRDGDTVLVSDVMDTVTIMGDVAYENLYEFNETHATLDKILTYALPASSATHFKLVSKEGGTLKTSYLPLSQSVNTEIKSGDEVTVYTQYINETVSVSVEGEHNGDSEIVVKHGATLQEVLDQITPSVLSDVDSFQLYRESVKVRQKVMLESSLKSLESSLLTARSNTSDEANLRAMEAKLVLQWVERAREIEPKGQVVIKSDADLSQIFVEAGDVIKIPRQSSIVLIHGDVVAPSAASFAENRTVEDYIDLAGGFNQKAKNSKVLVLHRDGSFTKVDSGDIDEYVPLPGDEVVVLPQIATKSLQVTKDMTQIIYQIAVSAGTVLRMVM
ncbi:polysaccharide biosynthesis/export family protein [Vibrio barjaei]|uniref:polysaccharide biosynthesis/export family protein n=1 Tax=Vibrio barjaei TaxID=1676683 RepID=UPI00228451C3|nr:polysaccharide biosynthesis/export family protein [Vibrio barjaei]MCY9872372.1 polysaccharide export protein [Vibrio barjaei]